MFLFDTISDFNVPGPIISQYSYCIMLTHILYYIILQYSHYLLRPIILQHIMMLRRPIILHHTCTYRYIHIYIYVQHHFVAATLYAARNSIISKLHPVSITRFPLTRLSPGSGLLRNRFLHWQRLRFSRVWVRKDGNLVTETGCIVQSITLCHMMSQYVFNVFQCTIYYDAINF